MKRVLKPKNSVSADLNAHFLADNADSAVNLQQFNLARALYYDFFAGFFLYELLDSRFDLFIKQIEILALAPLNDADLAHFSALKRYLSSANLQSIKREYTQGFNLPFCANASDSVESSDSNVESSADSSDSSADFAEKGKRKKRKAPPNPQIFLYLSHYVEGCLNGVSLLKAKQLVKQTRFRLNREGFKESEEHFGFLLLFMRYLLQESRESKESRDSCTDSRGVNPRDFFNECLRPMGSKIADLLAAREDMPCYKEVGALLKNFITLEEKICET